MAPRRTSQVPFRSPAWRAQNAFSLVELLVGSALLLIIIGMLVTMVNMTTFLWNSTTGGVQDFQRARQAFDILNARLSQAALNTFWDYDNTAAPTKYVRQSELRFLNGKAADLFGGTAAAYPGQAVFFQAPGAASVSGSAVQAGALCTWGYFVEYGSDSSYMPEFLAGVIPARYRYRLIEFMEPSNQLSVYQYTSGTNGDGTPKNLSYTGKEWCLLPLASAPSNKRIIAENVVALVIQPKLSPHESNLGTQLLAPHYTYDSAADGTGTAALLGSKNQLPPLVEISMIVVDERSVARKAWRETPPQLGLETLFQDATRQADDLNTLEETLRSLGLSPRRFNITVPIRGAKWSVN